MVPSNNRPRMGALLRHNRLVIIVLDVAHKKKKQLKKLQPLRVHEFGALGDSLIALQHVINFFTHFITIKFYYNF